MKIISLLIGKANSSGFPGKNIMEINGMPSCEYACKISSELNVERSYVSTDCPHIARIASNYNFKHIVRPPELATTDALTEDALQHAYNEILKDGDFDLVVLMFANNPAISLNLVKEGIDSLIKDETYDSAFSVCKYNMFSPARARKIEENTIKPFIDLDLMENVSSIRSSQGDAYFCDLSVQVIRSRVFKEMDMGQLPFKWQGKKSMPLFNNYGFDIDEPWQKVAIEKWLKDNWNIK
tara:strand:+ start:278 stop:991 length:714 start_codon:yes stop_codon:yes gene_type:complete